MAAATRKVHGRIHVVVSSAELTVDQWSVLDRIAAIKGPVSMAAVAETTGLTGPSLTRAVDKLVTAALVFREVDASDRRRVLVDLSTRGVALHAELAPLVYSAESEVVEGSSTSVDELVRVLRGLTR
ncbi:MarR family transcriptional regulator [Nesterenkonia sp. AY15]|uniref:MarR family winged helix-turn-helix transcriptional regulator n=1 Tax=Nesterenkonia sp. AY15 TaxID=2901139 RepID=UPI001F4D1721|nr:MarR family transcriptional regulator [Nesterenkonia sp. AY15]MCH8571583.1 MarR family transcriptional regulator [Nesterenkonia sp. AY15]